jgi:phage terminase large subunit-like protein
VARQRKTQPLPSRGKPESRGDRNIRWIENYCRVPEGKLGGQPVTLREWQRFEIRKIYDNPHGTRRAIISFGRKNGKTALACFLCLLHLCGPEAVPNSQLFSAAQSRDQAAILFALAAKVVRLSPDLNDVVTIRDTAKQLFCKDLGTLYRALSAEASTAYGLSPVFIVHDELGQVRGPRSELYEALETATGAQERPLSIVISTQAPNPNDLLSVLIDDAETNADPRVVLSLYAAPESLDPFAEETIKLANPAFGDFQNATETLAMAQDASRMPSKESEFRNLILNQRVETISPFISKKTWDECGATPHKFDGPVYGGLDLSAVSDLTALVYVSAKNDVWGVNPVFWLPRYGLEEKSRQDRETYDIWHKEGFLEATPGKSIDYDFVAARLWRDYSEMDIRRIAFDRFNMRHLKPCLIRAGFREEHLEGDDATFVEFGQGYVSMSPALRTLEATVLEGKLAHGMHPVLRMCAGCAVVTQDAAGNRKLDKSKATGRIDGMVALAMALSVAVTDTEKNEPNEDDYFAALRAASKQNEARA